MPDRQTLRIRWPFRKLLEHPLIDGLAAKLGATGSPIHAGWGYRPSGRSAAGAAAKSGGKLLLMEDAFIRSMKPGAGRIYGIVADSRGIYYDATGNSDLIDALNNGKNAGWMRDTPENKEREIHELISLFTSSQASKYNWYPGDFLPVERPGEAGVMVVDQTRGDTSITCGGVRETDFDRMVRDALDEHPGKPVYLRSHPDHEYRGKHSCFSPWVFEEPRVKILPSNISPAECFEFCEEVYAATSLMGMEAMLHGRNVKTYGWNFYAGWGLTEDRCSSPAPPRTRKVPLERLFEAAYLQYSHYFDPDTGAPCGLERIVRHIALQRNIARENAGTRISVSWDPWKRSLAKDFFNSPGNKLLHLEAEAEITPPSGPAPARLLVWGARPVPAGNTLPVTRVEDGFLRSNGLGAQFHRPLSWVLDDEGIYFDPTIPSRLETILETTEFTPTSITEAREVAAFLKTNHLSKYNLDTPPVSWKRDEAAGRQIILIPGQVELDASIKKGSPEIRSNGELLRRVRQDRPDAYLIFKCHPDLVGNARHGQLLPDGAESIADLVVTDGNITEWLELCDEVHTMTSTVGFEAIFRGIPVKTYGLPFYAGWGLSEDLLRCPRRTRSLTIDELVCGVLIHYPRYLNPLSGEFTTAIQIARLLAQRGKTKEARPLHLRIVSILKAAWVRMARRQSH